MINSTISKDLINRLKPQLGVLCNQADPRNFKDVEVIALKNGSIIAESVAQYNYPNNNSEIMFLNKGLKHTLEAIFSDTENIRNLNQTVGPIAIQDTNIILQASNIKNISNLKPFMSCDLDFSNYTLEIINGVWQCSGYCKTHPDYCNQHGQCSNMKTGPNCVCDSSPLVQYQGQQCEMFQRGAGFYGLLFGVLGAALLLFIALIVAVLVLKRRRKGEQQFSSNLHNRRFMFPNEDFFNFSNTDLINRDPESTGLSGRAGRYDLDDHQIFPNAPNRGSFRPLPENPYKSSKMRFEHPEGLPSSTDQ
ncbi:mucin-4 [Conger conger]|uniref:mucin-4 n=1 Tax=Conger conger TaxID=82655 RepID=UPI002A5A16E0|nr:mucin-4 [Conger conger]